MLGEKILGIRRKYGWSRAELVHRLRHQGFNTTTEVIANIEYGQFERMLNDALDRVVQAEMKGRQLRKLLF